jgi:hypothetical protein
MPSTLSNFLHASGLTPLLPDGSNGTAPFSGFNQTLPTQTVPFELDGSGNAPQGIPLFPGGMASHTSSGLSNLHGSYSGSGSFTLLGFTGPTTGTFQGSFDFVAANGDQLDCNYGAGSPGTFTITPVANGNVIVQFLAVFTPIPSQCTGRFASVLGGGFTMVAVTQPFNPTPNAQGYTAPFQYSWEGQGMLLEQASAPPIKAPFLPLPLTYAAPSLVAPFETAGAGHAPQGVPLFPGGMASHDATGGINLLGTYYGKYSGPGEYTLLNFTSPTTGNFHGTFDFTAPNGDQLFCTYGASTPGTFAIYPVANGNVVVQFDAVFAPITSECTGAFANITGGNFVMIATTDPFNPTPNAQGYTAPFTYSWVGAGLFLENPPQGSNRGILSLFDFGELAAALASLENSATLAAHRGGAPDALHGAVAPLATTRPLFAAFDDGNTPALHRTTAAGDTPLDTDALFSALNGNPFVTLDR